MSAVDRHVSQAARRLLLSQQAQGDIDNGVAQIEATRAITEAVLALVEAVRDPLVVDSFARCTETDSVGQRCVRGAGHAGGCSARGLS